MSGEATFEDAAPARRVEPSPARPLVLVGAGKMGGALLEGWLAAGFDPRALVVVEPSPDPEQAALTAPGLTVVAEPPRRPAHTLVLAVKPQVMDEALSALGQAADERTLVVSIAAGITIARLGEFASGPIVRAIPNTPAAIGEGMTAAVAAGASEADVAFADRLLGAVGRVAWVEDEALIDVATAVCGSGPAYVFHLAEALASAGAAEGLPPDVAAMLARQTVVGAGALLGRSALDPATLRRNVTSPGGTTAAALCVLADTGALTELMTRAVHAATVRSRELGR
ncbi:pyrroline-5-carboxylate reductase [Acuticoccus sp.]|uniref:pyrroline-5-carboxylate reductase n=1 Tax=Acuticoccus sp. TaxID=1904378 RepID=UPI003B52A633